MGFSDKIINSRKHLFRLVTGKNNGMNAWWYVRVFNEKFEQYKLALKSDSINLEAYGEIIDCGWGKTPPETIMKEFAAS